MSRFDSPDAESRTLDETYARRFAGMEARRSRVWDTLNRTFFHKWITPDDVVLDLGAGYCEFINSICAKAKFALDLNPATRQRANQGVTVVSQDVTQTWQLADNSVDVIFTSNFLEHLENKNALVHCLRESFRVLRKGGRLIAMGPNIRFAYDVYWDYFDHYLPLSDRSLVEAAELNGFKMEVVIPRFLPYTMRGRMPSHPLLIRIYLMAPIVWRIFGKQFLVIAKK